jgi:drug/metabolite transporter (DMT)-like permease
MLACIYTSVKYLPLVYVSLVSNIGPLFIAIFSWLLIKKGLNRNETITLVVSFIGVCILVTGNTSQKENNLGNTQKQESLWFPILLLMMIPVLTGTLSMTQRQLRNVSEYTTGTYISYSMLVVFGPLILIQDS